MSEMVNQVSKVTVRWAMLVIIFVFMAGLIGVAYRGDQADKQIDKNTSQIAKSITQIKLTTEKLRLAVIVQCQNRNRAAVGTNETLVTLIKAVSATSSIDAPEKARRVILYKSVMVPIIQC